jgi:glycosyltransferase involved in cell wall biosynthesis
MKTIAILGTGPLPIERESYSYGSSNRTWHFAKGLLDRGYRVHVIAFRLMRVENGREISDPEHRKFEEGAFTLDSIDAVKHFYNDDFLKARIREAGAEILIGVNNCPAARLGSLELDLPLWADLNGYNMGEVQARAKMTGDESAIPHGWYEGLPALCRADVFSAASHPQRYALIGELGAIGRLSGATCGHEFVYVIPNGREDVPPPQGVSEIRTQLGIEAVLALWIGSYNYHFDVDTLFEGIDAAMNEFPQLHFVSTGGKVDGHNELTFETFRGRIANSPNRDRYHFLGWIAQEEFERVLRDADFGVSLDHPCYETEIGARNRLTDMMRAGLPMISTEGPEISQDLETYEAGWRVPKRETNAFVSALEEACASREERERRGRNARGVYELKYTLEASLKPLLDWVENPTLAPDRGRRPLLLPPPPGAPPQEAHGFLSRLKHFALGTR